MNKIKKNIVYQTIYQLLNIAIPLVTTPIVTRALGPSVLGNYSYTNAIVSYFSLFALLGMNNYGTREIAKANSENDKLHLSKTFWNIYAMQFYLSIIVIACYIVYCFSFCNELFTLSIIQGILLLATATDISWFYFGLEEFKVTVTRNIAVRLISAIAIIGFIKTANDVYRYAAIVTGSQLISNMILLFSLRGRVIKVRPTIVEILKHFKPNLMLFIPVVAASFYVYIDKIMIGTMAKDYDVGYYEGMEKIINVPNALLSSVALVMYPRISALVKKNESGSIIAEYIGKSVLAVSFFSVGAFFGLMSVSDMLVPLFLGPGYESVILLLCLGGAILIPRGLRQVVKSEILLPIHKDKQVTIAIVLGALIDFAINLLLIPQYKAVGATIATIICECASCILMVLFTRKKWVYKTFLPLIPFSIFGGIMLFSLRQIRPKLDDSWINLLIMIIVGALIYCFLSGLYVVVKQKFTIKKIKDMIK